MNNDYTHGYLKDKNTGNNQVFDELRDNDTMYTIEGTVKR